MLLPGINTLQICPLHWSNSKSEILPSFLQSRMLMTSLLFSSEKSISEAFLLRQASGFLSALAKLPQPAGVLYNLFYACK